MYSISAYYLLCVRVACVLEKRWDHIFLECFFLLFPCAWALFDHLILYTVNRGRQAGRPRNILACSYYCYFSSQLFVVFETIRFFFYVEREEKKIFRPKHNIALTLGFRRETLFCVWKWVVYVTTHGRWKTSKCSSSKKNRHLLFSFIFGQSGKIINMIFINYTTHCSQGL